MQEEAEHAKHSVQSWHTSDVRKRDTGRGLHTLRAANTHRTGRVSEPHTVTSVTLLPVRRKCGKENSNGATQARMCQVYIRKRS